MIVSSPTVTASPGSVCVRPSMRLVATTRPAEVGYALLSTNLIYPPKAEGSNYQKWRLRKWL